MNEQSYILGSERAWIHVLQLCLQHLDNNDSLVEKSRLILERTEVVHKLRSLCEDFGDNDWEPNLHLADIIDKHLAVYLYSK